MYVIITSCKRCGHRGISPASIVDDDDDDDDDDRERHAMYSHLVSSNLLEDRNVLVGV